jgi:hypothetical protein
MKGLHSLAAALALLLVHAVSAPGQNPFEPDYHIGCVERLRVPGYSAAARQAGAEGTITSKVVLAADASAELITSEFQSKTQTAIGWLMQLVDQSIREATFRPGCGGETLTLVFNFRIEGRPSDNPQQSVSFGYPNHFWIVTEPGRKRK